MDRRSGPEDIGELDAQRRKHIAAIEHRGLPPGGHGVPAAALPAYGAQRTDTPAIDSLAAEAVVFERAYALCEPFAEDPKGERTLAQRAYRSAPITAASSPGSPSRVPPPSAPSPAGPRPGRSPSGPTRSGEISWRGRGARSANFLMLGILNRFRTELGVVALAAAFAVVARPEPVAVEGVAGLAGLRADRLQRLQLEQGVLDEREDGAGRAGRAGDRGVAPRERVRRRRRQR